MYYVTSFLTTWESTLRLLQRWFEHVLEYIRRAETEQQEGDNG